MQRWEYKIAKLTQGATALERELNQMGAAGWELVHIQIDTTSSLTRGQGEGLLGTFKRPGAGEVVATPQDLVRKQSAQPPKAAPPPPPAALPQEKAPISATEDHHDPNRLDDLSEEDERAIEALFNEPEAAQQQQQQQQQQREEEQEIEQQLAAHQRHLKHPEPAVSEEEKAAVRAMMGAEEREEMEKKAVRARMEGKG